MGFKTIAIDKLPAKAAFGKAKAYSDEDIAEVIKLLAKPEAVSNGVEYADKQTARNAGGTLRASIIKAHPDMKEKIKVTTVPTSDKDDAKHVFYVVPVKKD